MRKQKAKIRKQREEKAQVRLADLAKLECQAAMVCLIAAWDEPRRCRVCGCTWTPCVDHSGSLVVEHGTAAIREMHMDAAIGGKERGMKAPVMTEAEKAQVLGDDQAALLELAELDCMAAMECLLAAWDETRRCRVCGCTWTPCVDHSGRAPLWEAWDLCSACAGPGNRRGQ